MKTDEVCDRPLDPFAADTPMRLCGRQLENLRHDFNSMLNFSRSKGNVNDSPC